MKVSSMPWGILNIQSLRWLLLAAVLLVPVALQAGFAPSGLNPWHTASEEEAAPGDEHKHSKDKPKGEVSLSKDSRSWELPAHVCLSYAEGYSFQEVKILVNSFRKHVPGAALVIFLESKPKDWQEHEGVFLQIFQPAEGSMYQRLLPAVARRIVVFSAFLHQRMKKHKGRVIFCDAQDVVFLGDAFAALDDRHLHFFQEDGRFPPKDGPKVSNNKKWLATCYGEEEAEKVVGRSVINGGFVIGTTSQVRKLLALMTQHIQERPVQCSSRFGVDQAITNQLVHSGELEREVARPQLHNTRAGPVLLLFNKATHFALTPASSDGLVQLASGRHAVVVHGYNRHEALNTTILATYAS